MRSGAALNAAPSSTSLLSGVSFVGTAGPFFYIHPFTDRVIYFRLQPQCWLSLERRDKERRESFPFIFLAFLYFLFAFFSWRCCIAAAALTIGLDPFLTITTKEKRRNTFFCKIQFIPTVRRHCEKMDSPGTKKTCLGRWSSLQV